MWEDTTHLALCPVMEWWIVGTLHSFLSAFGRDVMLMGPSCTYLQWWTITWNCELNKSFSPKWLFVRICYHSSRSEIRILGFLPESKGGKVQIYIHRRNNAAVLRAQQSNLAVNDDFISSCCWGSSEPDVSRVLVSYLKKKNNNNNDKAHANCKVARSFIKETIGHSGKE